MRKIESIKHRNRIDLCIKMQRLGAGFSFSLAWLLAFSALIVRFRLMCTADHIELIWNVSRHRCID